MVVIIIFTVVLFCLVCVYEAIQRKEQAKRDISIAEYRKRQEEKGEIDLSGGPVREVAEADKTADAGGDTARSGADTERKLVDGEADIIQQKAHRSNNASVIQDDEDMDDENKN